VLVVEGRGSTEVWQEGQNKRHTFEALGEGVARQLKMNAGCRAVHDIRREVPHKSSAGALAALMKRWKALSGTRTANLFAISKVWRLFLAFLPHFRRAAALDHQHDLFVEVALDVERAGAGNLDHVGAPEALGAVELDIAAAPAEPLSTAPWPGSCTRRTPMPRRSARPPPP